MGTEVWGVKVTFSLTSGGLRDWTFTQAFARDISDGNSYPTSCLQTSQVPLAFPTTQHCSWVSLAPLPASLFQFLSKEQKILQLLYKSSAGFNPAFL